MHVIYVIFKYENDAKIIVVTKEITNFIVSILSCILDLINYHLSRLFKIMIIDLKFLNP